MWSIGNPRPARDYVSANSKAVCARTTLIVMLQMAINRQLLTIADIQALCGQHALQMRLSQAPP